MVFYVDRVHLVLKAVCENRLCPSSVTFGIADRLLYSRHLCRVIYSFRLSVRPFVCSFVCSFVRSLFSVTFEEFTSKFC